MSNTTLLVILAFALLIVVAAVLLLRKPKTIVAAISKPAEKTEGHGLVDSAAAALLDVSGPLLGVDAHADLPSDDLTQIKGLGPRAAAVLNGIGIHRYAQLAELDPAQATEVDRRMGAFQGRIARDQWVEQARYLEQDDVAGFETKFGKLG